MKMIEKRMEQRGQGGFTLIELLVVIAILAVLGGAVIIGIGAMRGNAEEQVCKTNKETIELAAEAYRLDQDPPAWPADVQALVDAGLIKSSSINPGAWTLNDGLVTAQTEYDGLGGDDGPCDPTP